MEAAEVLWEAKKGGTAHPTSDSTESGVFPGKEEPRLLEESNISIKTQSRRAWYIWEGSVGLETTGRLRMSEPQRSWDLAKGTRSPRALSRHTAGK